MRERERAEAEGARRERGGERERRERAKALLEGVQCAACTWQSEQRVQCAHRVFKDFFVFGLRRARALALEKNNKTSTRGMGIARSAHAQADTEAEATDKPSPGGVCVRITRLYFTCVRPVSHHIPGTWYPPLYLPVYFINNNLYIYLAILPQTADPH